MDDPTIRFTCPFCRLQLSAPQQHAGAVVQCPACRQQMIVPVLQSAASGPDNRLGLALPPESPSAEEALCAFFDSQRKQQEEEAQAKRNLRAEMDQSGREFCMAELVRYYSALSNEQLVEAIATPASTVANSLSCSAGGASTTVASLRLFPWVAKSPRLRFLASEGQAPPNR